ncbi:MAG: chalcone isomerase family protein [Pseudomonadota bacterium]|nr:chalcone isomerase family protein [Pseudomonadota bacterium]
MIIKNLIILVFLATTAQAAKIYDVEFVDKEILDEKELVLNGLGTRLTRILFVPIKVYVAGLYIEKKTKLSNEIIESTSPKKVVLHFLREVSKSKVTEGWEVAFKNNCGALCEEQKPLIKRFLTMMTDMQSGDRMVFSVFSDHLQVTVKNKDQGAIFDPHFPKTIMSVFIGKEPPNPELKEGLLGGSK